jgi:hypothetical protein
MPVVSSSASPVEKLSGQRAIQTRESGVGTETNSQ